MRVLHKAMLFLAFLPMHNASFGQRYQIEGTVRDSETLQPIVAAGIVNKLNDLYYHDIHLDTVTGRIYMEFPQGPFTPVYDTGFQTHRKVPVFE